MKTKENGGSPIRDDTVSKIMRYEGGEMSQAEMVDFFQEIVDTGLVWQLQGSYGRTAAALIEAGYVHTRTQ